MCFIIMKGVASFSRALVHKNCTLLHLNLSDCEAGDEAAVSLASALMEGKQAQHDPKESKNGSLSQLDLSSNQITMKGWSHGSCLERDYLSCFMYPCQGFTF